MKDSAHEERNWRGTLRLLAVALLVAIRRLSRRRTLRSSEAAMPAGGDGGVTDGNGQSATLTSLSGEAPAPAIVDDQSGADSRDTKTFLGLCVLAGLSLVIIALGVNGAREVNSWGEAVYWGGLLLLIVPCSLRLAGSSASRGERVGLILLVGLGLLAVEYFISPLGFTNHDEFGHLRETFDIMSTRHLFPFDPIEAEYTSFPGTAIATSTFAHFSGLSILSSWRLVFLSLRIITLLALFLILERATRSPRCAGLGVLLYLGNPSFMYFDAHFAYESFALPLGILLFQRATAVEETDSRVASWILFMLVLVALTVSHHIAAYIFVAMLALLAITEQLFRRRSISRRMRRRTLALYTTLGAASVAAWTALIAPTTITKYLGPVLREAVSSTVSLATGSHAAEKTLFESQNKQASPIWEQALGFAAVGLLLVLGTWGLWRLWRWRRLASPLPAALALIAVAYPGTLILRLTLNGTETSDRASGYVYIGLAYVVAAGAFVAAPNRAIDDPSRRGARLRKLGQAVSTRLSPFRALSISLSLTLVMIGGIIVGTSRVERLPGPYYPAVVPPTSIDPESIAAAKWVSGHLTHRQLLFSDIDNRLQMSSYGRENAVCCYVGDQLLANLFLMPTFTKRDVELIGLFHIRLIVVDQRLEKPTPSTHLFSERSDGGPYYKPLARQALTKFARAPGIDELFDSGNISIYSSARYAR
jgi:hypothetical protein